MIVHIDTETGFRGGQQQVLWLMDGLRARGVRQVLLATHGSELVSRAQYYSHEVIQLASSKAWNPLAWWAVARAVEGSNLVHAHASHAHRLAWHAVGGKIPIVVTRRVDFPVGQNSMSRKAYAGEGQRFIAISTAIRQVLIDGGVSPDNIRVVPSGVMPDRLIKVGGSTIRADLDLVGAQPLIGCTAALVDHKDPLNLVEALALVRQQLPDAAVIWAGEGPLRRAVEQRVRALGLAKHFILAGWREDIGAVLDAINLFVMPSRMEGLCTALIDAQALGVPCIATRAGGIPDIITHGENGLIANTQDPKSLAQAIVRLWEDAGLRREFAQAGPRIAREKFSVDQMVEGTLKVYRELVGDAVSVS